MLRANVGMPARVLIVLGSLILGLAILTPSASTILALVAFGFLIRKAITSVIDYPAETIHKYLGDKALTRTRELLRRPSVIFNTISNVSLTTSLGAILIDLFSPNVLERIAAGNSETVLTVVTLTLVSSFEGVLLAEILSGDASYELEEIGEQIAEAKKREENEPSEATEREDFRCEFISRTTYDITLASLSSEALKTAFNELENLAHKKLISITSPTGKPAPTDSLAQKLDIGTEIVNGKTYMEFDSAQIVLTHLIKQAEAQHQAVLPRPTARRQNTTPPTHSLNPQRKPDLGPSR